MYGAALEPGHENDNLTTSTLQLCDQALDIPLVHRMLRQLPLVCDTLSPQECERLKRLDDKALCPVVVMEGSFAPVVSRIVKRYLVQGQVFAGTVLVHKLVGDELMNIHVLPHHAAQWGR